MVFVGGGEQTEEVVGFDTVLCEEFQCKVYGFCIMGNHYHLIVEFLKPRKLPRKFL